jgi:hypothetical protein
MQQRHTQPSPEELHEATLKSQSIERLSENWHLQIDASRDKLQREIEDSLPLQYSLLKYLVSHPERLELVGDLEIFDREPRSIYYKLKKYVDSIKGTKERFDLALLTVGYFDGADKFFFETEVERAEDLDTEFNARQTCEALQTLHNELIRFQTAFAILHAQDTSAAAIYGKQLARMTEDLPVHATVFSTDTRLQRTKYSLKHCGVPILEDSNFYIIMGREKSGKSHVLSVFLAAYLFGKLESFSLESMIGSEDKILYIDTEQSASDAHNICQTANLLAGRNYDAPNDRLIIASCDEVPPSQMLSEVQQLVEQYRPKVVFIDGYAGLLEDAYLTKGADPLMREIRNLARHYNLVIMGVFHAKTEDNPLAPEKAPNVSAFGAFGKICQKYGGGTFYVETQEGFLTKVEQIQARKSKCPTFYCKFDGVIYIDVPGSNTPDMCPVIDGNTDEILQPRHLDINDDCVHSFFVPHYLTEGEYLEKADIADIQEEKKAEERKAQKAQLKMESDKDKFREELAIIFKDDAETLSKEENNARWFEYARIQEDEDKLDKKTKDRWKKRLKRCLDSSLKLEILRQYPSGLYGLINLPSQK